MGLNRSDLSIDTAMVMAAGLGSRMRPLTNDRPKPLIELAGRTLLDHMLDRLAEDGVDRAVVNVHYFPDLVERHLASRIAPTIVISDEREALLETGGGLVKARSHLGDAPIYVCNSDSIWSEEAGGSSALETLRAVWDGARMDALLLLADRTRSIGYDGRGDFFLASDGQLTRRGAAASAPYAYMGVQIFNPALIDGHPLAKFSLNRMWDTALAQGRVYGAVLAGEWMHVGDPHALAEAEARLGPLTA